MPIAAANAIGYLAQTFGQSRGFNAPHFLTKGVVNGNTLPAQLDNMMLRPVTDTCNGSGTGYCPDFNGDSSLLAGASSYLDNWNDADRLHFRYQGEDVNDELCVNGMAVDAVSDGAQPTFDWICDRIEAGDGIVLTYHRYNADDEYTGGHAIRVHGCGVMGGLPFIRVLNDTKQDRMDESLCVERDGLESQMVFLEDLDQDGRLNYGGNLGREVTFALAISIDP